jgi:hypothetical protein
MLLQQSAAATAGAAGAAPIVPEKLDGARTRKDPALAANVAAKAHFDNATTAADAVKATDDAARAAVTAVKAARAPSYQVR